MATAGLAMWKYGMSDTVLMAAKRANVRHHVVVSIVGVDRLGQSPYFDGKLAQERLVVVGRDREHAVEVLERQRLERAAHGDAGVVDEHVEPAELRDGAPGQGTLQNAWSLLWYERVIRIFFDETHTLKVCDVVLGEDAARLKIVVEHSEAVCMPSIRHRATGPSRSHSATCPSRTTRRASSGPRLRIASRRSVLRPSDASAALTGPRMIAAPSATADTSRSSSGSVRAISGQRPAP